MVHRLSCYAIWYGGDPGAVPPSAAPDEGVLVRVPVRGGAPEGFFDLGPNLAAAALGTRERRIFPTVRSG